MPKKLKCTHPAPGLGLAAGDVETFDNARAAELLTESEGGLNHFVLEADLGADASDDAPEGEAYNPGLLAKRAAEEKAETEAKPEVKTDEQPKDEPKEDAPKADDEDKKAKGGKKADK